MSVNLQYTEVFKFRKNAQVYFEVFERDPNGPYQYTTGMTTGALREAYHGEQASEGSENWKQLIDILINQETIGNIYQNLRNDGFIHDGNDNMLVVCPAANIATHEYWLYRALTKENPERQVQLVAGDILTEMAPKEGIIEDAFNQDNNLHYLHFDAWDILNLDMINTNTCDLIMERYGSIWYMCSLIMQNKIGPDDFWQHLSNFQQSLKSNGILVVDNVPMHMFFQQPSTMEMIYHAFEILEKYNGIPIQDSLNRLHSMFDIQDCGDNTRDFVSVTVLKKRDSQS